MVDLVNSTRETFQLLANKIKVIGSLSSLTTTNKTSIVAAINEINVTKTGTSDYLNLAANGTTDDSPAVIAALDALPSSGGTIKFPPNKTIRLNGSINILKDNITIDLNGSTIAKTNIDAFYVLIFPSFRGPGYGGGARNFVLKNGTVKGSFASGTTRGVGFVAHHAQNLRVENVKFVECAISSHIWDLGGCKGVAFVNCVFEGYNVQAGSERMEAIQLDYSYYVGANFEGLNSTRYDGLGTRDVLIEGCQFIPLTYTVGGTTYPYAMNPFGGHTKMQNAWIENVTFRDNRVEGCRNTSDLSSFPTTRGWIHMFHGRNITIESNLFINVSGRTSMAIQLDGSSGTSGYLQSQVGTAASDGQSITAQPPSDIDIRGNAFQNFNGQAQEPIIMVKGFAPASTAPYSSDINISDNTFKDCYTGTTIDVDSQTCIEIRFANAVNIRGNQSNKCGEMVYMNDVRSFSVVDNHTNDSYAEFMLLTGCKFGRVSNNSAIICSGGIRLNTTSSCVVSGNTFGFGSTTGAIRTALIDASATAYDFLIVDNILYGNDRATNGVLVTNTTYRGRVERNIALDCTTGISVSRPVTDPTPVTSANNITS